MSHTGRGRHDATDWCTRTATRALAYGHFGRDESGFTWENTDKAAALRAAADLG